MAIHVTTNPNEALVMKCDSNLQEGLKPTFLLKNSDLAHRVDVLDISQFLTANIYERSLFKAADCRATFSHLIQRYNEIITLSETDPTLRIQIETTR